MKKLLLGLGSLIFSLSTFGQLADGATAPNFTATDINGNTHTLYDYLDAGKVVILDFSATWCGPCWSFHQGHVLKNIHEAYGPDGTDEAVVLFIEADGSTTYQDLLGTGGSTQGDWVTGTPYPIIDDASFASSYSINSFPTFYVVCPDRTVTHYDQTTEAPNAQTWGDISEYIVSLGQACGAGNMDGSYTNAALDAYTGEEQFCAGTPVALEATVTNNGTEVIAAIDVKVMDGATEIFNSTFNGPMEVFGTYVLDLGTYTPSANTDLDIIITTADGKASDNSLVASLTSAPIAANQVSLAVTTDGYADEISWSLVDNGGNTVASATYTAADNSTTKNHILGLQNMGCYTFTIEDSYGDGIINGGYEISSNGSVIASDFSNYGSSSTRRLNQDGSSVSIEENNLAVNVYPNPAANEVYVSANDNFTKVEIVDLNGKVINVIENADLDNYLSLDASNLVNGVYFVKIYSENNTFTTQKLQIAK